MGRPQCRENACHYKWYLAFPQNGDGQHERLRQFFYGYLFTDKPFVKIDYDRVPPFEPGE